jgi:hypothetical protein
MSFGLYFIGFIILIAGLVYGAVLLNIPQHWIIVGVIILLGLGITSGVTSTRRKDQSQ